MGDKVNNVQALMNNPKQRNIYLMGVGAAVVTLIAGFFYATSGKNQAVQGGAQVAKIPTVESTPGASSSPDYTRKVVESNAQKAESAIEKGGTFVPTVVKGDTLTTESPLDSLDKQIKAQREAEAQEQAENKPVQPVEQPVVSVTPEPVQPIQQVQAPVQMPVAPPPPPKKYGTDEDFLIMQAITGVSGIKASKSEFDYTGQKSNNQGFAQQGGSSFNQPAVASQSTQKGQLLAKAGTIFNAILETGINSDEPSPVLAKIVTGDLKGTRLIGRISVSGEKVVVQFNVASIPEMPTSIKLNSVAVDPATSRTGLATDVDRHYFLRYGVLLGSAFLGAYADALKDKNSTTTVTPEGAVVKTTGQKSSKDINREAIGGIGKEMASEAKTQISGLKPTITVDAGTPIGILIMDDFYSGQ